MQRSGPLSADPLQLRKAHSPPAHWYAAEQQSQDGQYGNFASARD